MRFRHHFFAAAISLVCATLHSTPPAGAKGLPITDCDRLAANPDDLQRADGVLGELSLARIDAPAAILACEKALASHPGTPRFLYQLARAIEARTGECEATLPLLASAAAGRHAEAAITIARCYERSRDDESGKKQGMEWRRRAVKLGSQTAQAHIAMYLTEGEFGYEKDPGKALQILGRLAERENSFALYKLSEMYRYGLFVRKNPECTFPLLLKAAERGDPRSQHLVATDFKQGRHGAPKDAQDRPRSLLPRRGPPVPSELR